MAEDYSINTNEGFFGGVQGTLLNIQIVSEFSSSSFGEPIFSYLPADIFWPSY